MKSSWRPWALAVALAVGAALRLAWPADMEFKADEIQMSAYALGQARPAPWLGLTSGVGLPNPAFGVAVFRSLGGFTGARDPLQLGLAVMILNSIALVLVVWLARARLSRDERPAWYWAAALAAVNPLLVAWHRKIWAQSVLPFFCVLFLCAWLSRKSRSGALAWGLASALLGQIHMSGFFFAAGFFAFALVGPRRRQVDWRFWLLGFALGAWPLIPWLHALASHSGSLPKLEGWREAVQLKFWVFWLSDPLGLHLGQILGVHRGGGVMDQLGEFFREPRVQGRASWLIGAAHVVCLVSGVAIYLGAWPRLRAGWRRRGSAPGVCDDSQLAIASALLGMGLLLTATGVWLRRYYLLVTFPLEFVFLARCALVQGRRGEKLLIALACAELAISVGFLARVHREGGARDGDYGISYRLTRELETRDQSSGNSRDSSSQSRQRSQLEPGTSSSSWAGSDPAP